MIRQEKQEAEKQGKDNIGKGKSTKLSQICIMVRMQGNSTRKKEIEIQERNHEEQVKMTVRYWKIIKKTIKIIKRQRYKISCLEKSGIGSEMT